jgi:outer membrane biogenesis lipoprotein LolB
MKNITIIAIASFILTGCAARLVSTSPRTVVISAGSAQVQEAQDLADKECAKHGRLARLVGKLSPPSSHFTFDCVN